MLVFENFQEKWQNVFREKEICAVYLIAEKEEDDRETDKDLSNRKRRCVFKNSGKSRNDFYRSIR